MVAVGAVVLAPNGDVLLVRRKNPPLQGRWTLPGGKVEGGESLVEAVKREVLEETGLTVEVKELVEVVEVITPAPAPAFHYVIMDYLATSPIAVPIAGDDALDARFVPLSELGNYDLTASVHQVIAKALRMLTRVVDGG